MSQEPEREGSERAYDREAYYERRQVERRNGVERRGTLRWDPRAGEKERRSGERRRLR